MSKEKIATLPTAFEQAAEEAYHIFREKWKLAPWSRLPSDYQKSWFAAIRYALDNAPDK